MVHGQPSGVSAPVAARVEVTLMISALTGLFRLCANTAAAIFFYRTGPRLVRFLTGGESEPASTEPGFAG